MYRSVEEREEYIAKILEVIDEIRSSVDYVIVEGRRDRAALLELGIPGEMVISLSGNPLCEVVDFIRRRPAKNILILSDFDRHGCALFHNLSRAIELVNIRNNTTLRYKLRKLLSKDVKEIEAIPKLLRRLGYNGSSPEWVSTGESWGKPYILQRIAMGVATLNPVET